MFIPYFGSRHRRKLKYLKMAAVKSAAISWLKI
jgi:hypothetical protein